MPKISIIIPAYNAADYIQVTLSSVLSQTFKDWECIVVDDCSLDATGQIVQSYVQSDARFRYLLQQKNGGPAIARNTGIQEAQGDYLAFLDSDDTYEPAFLEKMLAAARLHHADVVWCNYQEILGSSVVERHHQLSVFSPLQDHSALALFFHNPVGLGGMCNKIYRRSLLVEHHLLINPQRYHGEDWEFNLNVFKSHAIIVAIPDVLHNYIRQNVNSVVASYHRVDWDNHVRSYRLLKSLSEEREIDYNVVDQNTQFIYISIAFIVALFKSTLPDKNNEFNRIVADALFQKVISGSEYDEKKLPIRFRICFWLIRMKFHTLCRLFLQH